MSDITDKSVDRRSFERSENLREADKPKPTQKEQKSAFDELLEKSRAQQGQFDARFQSQKTTQQGVNEADSQQEKRRHEKEDKDKEEKKESKGDGATDRSHVDTGHRKVVAKGGTGEREGHGSGSGESRGGGSFEKKSTSKNVELGKGEKARVGNFTNAEKFQQMLSKEVAQSNSRANLSPELIRELVRYVRMGVNRLGEKELQMDLHEEVFKGLKLHLTSAGGKVKVHFLTADGDTRRLFANSIPSLEKSLKEKGVLVESIQVS